MMRYILSLIFCFLLFCQNSYACSCFDIPSFKFSVENINKESNILILGEILEYGDYNSEHNMYGSVTINIIKDYIGNLKGKKVYLANGDGASCLKTFDYKDSSQLMILAIELESIDKNKQFYGAFLCQESVLYYDKANDLIKGNITPYNSFFVWLYSRLGIYPLPQNEMTLKEVELLIESSLE